MIKFKGDISGFPQEVVNKMLDYQVKQGNPRNVNVFEEWVAQSKNSSGFDWSQTKEGDGFWRDVIQNKNFDLFFKTYPKKPYPKVMLVSDTDSKEIGCKRVVFMEKKGKYFAWDCAKTLEEAENSMKVYIWDYAWDIEEEPMIELTIDDIAKMVGCDSYQIKIKK